MKSLHFVTIVIFHLGLWIWITWSNSNPRRKRQIMQRWWRFLRKVPEKLLKATLSLHNDYNWTSDCGTSIKRGWYKIWIYHKNIQASVNKNQHTLCLTSTHRRSYPIFSSFLMLRCSYTHPTPNHIFFFYIVYSYFIQCWCFCGAFILLSCILCDLCCVYSIVGVLKNN